MCDSILVGYATRYGSTQQVAETVATTLSEAGLEVELKLIRQVRTLQGYRGIVLGAPLFMFHWHKDALQFLSRHREALMQRPVAIFAGGPFTTGDEEEWQSSREQLDQELAKFSWLTPVAVEVVGGRYDPAKVHFPLSLFLKQIPDSDLRDWTAIRAWASNLAAKLQPALS